MESTKGYEKKINTLRQALEVFEQSLGITASGFDNTTRDTIKSGQAQKFEVCVELFWKTIKKFLYEIHGAEAVSPKMVMKQLYRLQCVEAPEYEALIEMINDRNRLSHVYDETQFDTIHRRLAGYRDLMQKVVELVSG